MSDFFDLWLLTEDDQSYGTISDRVIDQLAGTWQTLPAEQLVAKLEYLRKAVRSGDLTREGHRKLVRVLQRLDLHHDQEVWSASKNLKLLMGML